jgi:DNA-binding response OmpR family regulator
MAPSWKVLLVGLAGHGSLISKLAAEGHQIQVTDDLSEALLLIAAQDYDLIIIDVDEHPDEALLLCTWIADGASDAQVIQLTHWR